MDIEDIYTKWPTKHVNINRFIQVISTEGTYTLHKDIPCAANTSSRLLSILWPDRLKTTKPICYYLLEKYGLKYCPQCKLVYTREAFHSNISKQDKLGSCCINCFNTSVKDLRRVYQASKRAASLQRTPVWADFVKIKQIYKNCPIGYHVDHIIPLNGKLVSGLHVENNLQYLLAKDNIVKSNKFILA